MAIEISDVPTASPLVDNANRAAAAPRRSPYPGLTGLSAARLQRSAAAISRIFSVWKTLWWSRQRVRARVPVRRDLMAPHGYLHGGTLVSVADSLCGYGTIVNLPDDATGFVTIELKTNFLGTIRHGAMMCEATPAHIGRTTQIWDAVVTAEFDNRTLSIFRCSQLILRDGW